MATCLAAPSGVLCSILAFSSSRALCRGPQGSPSPSVLLKWLRRQILYYVYFTKIKNKNNFN